MTNPNAGKNRKKGDRQEYKTRDKLEADGYYVIRAGGSLGMFDFLAVKYGEPLRLIQVKSTKLLPTKLSTIYDLAIAAIEKFEAPSYAVKEFWIWYYRKKEPEIRWIN